MPQYTSINHHIQKYIIDVLVHVQVARFRDLRPPRTDTNLFSYHVNSLVKNRMVAKVEGGYTLGPAGLSYVDRVGTADKAIRTQPKIISMLLIQNSDGAILLQRRRKQPYITTWTLPYGKLHTDDPSMTGAAKRVAKQKLGLEGQALRHVGDCYIRVKSDEELISMTLAHIFQFNRDDIETSEDSIWAQPHKLRRYALAPAVEKIVARSFFNDPFFFEEFEEAWPIQAS